MPRTSSSRNNDNVVFITNEEASVYQSTDVIKQQQNRNYKVSNPSISIDEINVPEISEIKSEFIYNFYTKDERVSVYQNNKKSLEKIPRYVSIKWSSPKLSEFEISKINLEKKSKDRSLSIESNAEKIVSEDNFFNQNYINYSFSTNFLDQGSLDLELLSRLSGDNSESISRMAKNQIKAMQDKSNSNNENFQRLLLQLTNAYNQLANLPKSSLGLQVIDEKGKIVESNLNKEFIDSLVFNVKINDCVVNDVFKKLKDKENNVIFDSLKELYSQSQTNSDRSVDQIEITPVMNETLKTSAGLLTKPIEFLGYIVDRYVSNNKGYIKEKTFYIEDIQTTSLIDPDVLYGKNYTYAIRVVSSVKVLTYSHDETKVDVSTLYVASKPVSTTIECFEFISPPEPIDIKFTYDYQKNNLIIHWDMPVNPQKDIKQFQVFRRKSIFEPFELISQYTFDDSEISSLEESKYKTGEKVDGNNITGTSQENRYLIKESSRPVFMHRDEEFTVDTEFFVSSEYIYAVSSIDAHGLISNYSSQHLVKFDTNKNRLKVDLICDAGSPRQYPNMKLKKDAFKDAISLKGSDTKRMRIAFTPEYAKVRDEKSLTYNVVEAQHTNKNSYYVLQLINLDNQKIQTLKINIKDPKNLTNP